MTQKKTVVVESPYAGDAKKNLEFARACMRDCLARGEIPFASHLLYTQEGILDDSLPGERQLGLECGFEIAGRACDKTVVYCNLGITGGMKAGIEEAVLNQRDIEFRYLKLQDGWG